MRPIDLKQLLLQATGSVNFSLPFSCVLNFFDRISCKNQVNGFILQLFIQESNGSCFHMVDCACDSDFPFVFHLF